MRIRVVLASEVLAGCIWAVEVFGSRHGLDPLVGDRLDLGFSGAVEDTAPRGFLEIAKPEDFKTGFGAAGWRDLHLLGSARGQTKDGHDPYHIIA